MRKNFTILLLFLISVFSAQLAIAQTTFSNTNAITINDNASATPYPSSIVVSGMSGTIVSISVKINGFSHQFPSDVYMLLVGPGGQNLVFWGGAGGATQVSGLDITINDAASSALSQNSLITGTYRPSDYEAQNGLNVSFPSPAPASPYSKAAPTGSGTLASNFAGTSPNGTWNLYVEDVESGFGGSISGGWSITITHTVPSITTTNLSSNNLSPYTASPNNSVTLTATVTSTSTVNEGTVTFKNGTNDISGCDAQAVSNGTATCITSFSSAGKDTLSAQYNGTVNFAGSSGGNVVENIYQHPTLSIDDVSEYEGNSGTTTFTFTVTSSSPAGPGITFDVGTADNTATTTDNDYVANSLTNQSIHQDSTTYTFDVTVNGDTKVEPDENFYVNLSNVSANASISDGQGIGTIQNDDCTPQTYYADNDGDTYGDPGNSIQSCTQPDGYVTDHTDCNDNDAAINPATVWYKDADDDGYSDGTTQTQCERPSGYKLATELTATSGDCDDTDANTYPGAPEIADGKDNNCNGQIDEGLCTSPTITGIVYINSTHGLLTWSKVSTATSYTLRRYPTGTTKYIYKRGITDTALKFANLKPGVSYQAQVKSICGGGTDSSDWSAPFDFMTLDQCVAATKLKVTNVTATSATLSWTMPASSAVGFRLSYRILGTTEWTNKKIAVSTSYNLTNLSPSTSYEWRIRTLCNSDTSNWKRGKDFTTSSSSAFASQGSTGTNELIAQSKATVKVMPVPNNGNFIVQMLLPSKEAKTTVVLYNSLGEKVWQKDVGLVKGNISANANLENKLTNGIYTLVVERDDYHYTTKIVIGK